MLGGVNFYIEEEMQILEDKLNTIKTKIKDFHKELKEKENSLDIKLKEVKGRMEHIVYTDKERTKLIRTAFEEKFKEELK